MQYAAARDAVLTAVAAECGCTPADLLSPGVRIIERPSAAALARSPARRYPPREPALLAVSFGMGAVVAASPSLLAGVARALAGVERDGLFDATGLARLQQLIAPHELRMAGPFPKLLCGSDTLQRRSPPAGYSVSVMRGPDAATLAALEPARWPNVRGSRPDPRRPTVLLATAHAGDTLAGAVSVAADSDLLWQIGIDIAPDHRGRGLGVALTATLAEATLAAGRAPFYSTAAANLVSQRTALAAGFRLTWVEAHTMPAAR